MRLKRRAMRAIAPPNCFNESMNQKNLNYEIETIPLVATDSNGVPTMNQKNLNYEIETLALWMVIALAKVYESKESQL